MPCTIQAKAFEGFTSLASISISGSDVSIGADSFTGCTAITSLVFHTNQLSIQEGAFASANIPTINYTGSSFESGMAKFISSKIKAFNMDYQQLLALMSNKLTLKLQAFNLSKIALRMHQVLNSLILKLNKE